MMDIFGLFVDCLLRPVFETDLKLIKNDYEDDEDEDDDDDQQDERPDENHDDHSSDINGPTSASQMDSVRGKLEPKTRPRRKVSANKRLGDDMLDLEGPKLYDGCVGLIRYLQILGHVNWLNKPLYLSILYKLVISVILLYICIDRFYNSLIDSNIIDQNYRNPIFLFISLLAVISSCCHAIIGIYTNLFNLCPMFKILTTPKLCFIDRETQQIVGTRMLKFIGVFHIYNCVLCSMLRTKNLEEFFTTFHLPTFLSDSFALIVTSYHLFGLSHFDFYIRSSFGFWLIAMKFNLEHRFTFLHKYQRKQRMMEQKMLSWDTTNHEVATDDSELEPAAPRAGQPHVGRPNSSKSQQQLERDFKETYKFVTLDEIQKNLNNMDDHLEVWRSIQTSSLVVITLNAFLTNGTLLLLVYNLIVNQDNYYLGFVLLLMAVNYTVIVFLCYFGDSWISYALNSFVQTVEDEYFLQGGDEPFEQLQTGADHESEPLNSRRSPLVEPADGPAGRRLSLAKQHQSLLIKKKDVLFCREFLHQFENHLATPWSKLTVKTHLHMLGTFVTLIAAQIIFDHEH